MQYSSKILKAVVSDNLIGWNFIIQYEVGSWSWRILKTSSDAKLLGLW